MEARDEMDAVIRECLRFDPVAPMLFRHCEEDTIIEGEPIKQNTLVCLLAKTAMFDASVFRKPDEFIVSGPDRPAKDYLTFGIDPHQCRGQKMAEAILRIVLSRLVLLRDLHRAAGPIGEIQNMLGLPLPDSMVVRFDPRLPSPSIPVS
jgi:cytochrome P450